MSDTDVLEVSGIVDTLRKTYNSGVTRYILCSQSCFACISIKQLSWLHVRDIVLTNSVNRYALADKADTTTWCTLKALERS